MPKALFNNLPTEEKRRRKTADNLTPKQEAFARLIVEGKTATEAYREVYKPKKSTNKTIWEEACCLKKNPKVYARIEFLKTKAASDSIISQTEVLENISKIARQEKTDPKGQAVVLRANELMGKHYGLFEENLNLKQKTLPTIIKIVREAQK
ncbi:MAG: terminase small subunit [Elusimicrobiaceae bacterium]|nr:terminase small subunit [Elusimicrobiaceae bacterium]